MTKWTKGPWAKDRSGSLRSPKGKQIGVWDAGIAHVFRDSESEANAHLIAAAPELYEALVAILNFIENTESEMGITLQSGDKARKALSRARGEYQ